MSVLRKPSLRQLAAAVAALACPARRRGRSGQEGNRLRRHRRSLQRPDQAGHQAHTGKAGLHGARGRVQRLCAAQLRPGAGRAGRQRVPARGLPAELRGQEQAGTVRAGEGADRAHRHLQPEIQERGRRARGRERGRAERSHQPGARAGGAAGAGLGQAARGLRPAASVGEGRRQSEEDQAHPAGGGAAAALAGGHRLFLRQRQFRAGVRAQADRGAGAGKDHAHLPEPGGGAHGRSVQAHGHRGGLPLARVPGRDREILRRLRQDRRPAQAGGVR